MEPDEPPATPEPKPGWFTRLKQGWRKPVATAPPDPGKTTVIEKPSRERLAPARDAEEAGEASEPTPKPFGLGRLKNLLSLHRRKDAPEETADGQISAIEKPADRAASKGKDAADQNTEEAQPPQDKRFKRLLLRLRSKWVWIPATSITLLALITGVVMNMAQSAHEREKLKAELQTAKKKLEQKTVASVAAAKITPPIRVVAAAPETNKTNLATESAGESRAATNSGVDAGDCVVKDKDSVVQNLKNCIEGFNSAMANSPEKTRKR